MITTLHGDNTHILPTLKPKSVQCIVTSPPYFGLRDYGLPPTDWPEVSYTPLAGVPSVTIPAQSCCLGLEESPLAFIAHLVYVFRQARATLADDGVAWINLGDSYAQPSKWGGRSGNKNRPNDVNRYPRRRVRPDAGVKDKDLYGMPWRLALALQADGWYLRSDVIWDKPNGMCESVDDRPNRIHEYLFLLAKSRQYYYDHKAIAEPAVATAPRGGGKKLQHLVTGRGERNDGFAQRWQPSPDGLRNRRSIWRISSQGTIEGHYATYPEPIPELCILAGSRPGDTVLDMFAGSGTTMRVAERLQRHSIGIDLNADYIELQQRRTDGVQVEMVGLR